MKKKLVATFVLELLMVGVASVSQATDLTANMTVDDAFEMYVSTSDCDIGKLVCSSKSWYTATPCAITLTPDVPNYIHVVGRDVYTVIAGFLGDFKLSDDDFAFSNGTQSLLTNTTDWQVYIDGFCGTSGTITSQGVNGSAPWGGPIQSIDPAALWIWTGNGYDMKDPRYFSTMVIPGKTVTVPLTGIITTRDLELNTDQAQFKLADMKSVKAAAKVAKDKNIPMTFAFGNTCEAPIYKLNVPANKLNATDLNLRYTVGNLDVVRCVYNSGECVVNIKDKELKSLKDSAGMTLDDRLTGPMTVCLKVGKTTYTNSGTWTQYDSGSGSWTKYRKDIATEPNQP